MTVQEAMSEVASIADTASGLNSQDPDKAVADLAGTAFTHDHISNAIDYVISNKGLDPPSDFYRLLVKPAV
jgi:hypothetical protein